LKKLIIPVLLLSVALLFAGCKSPSQMAGELIGEKMIEAAGGGSVDIDGDKVTIKGESGEEVTIGETDWPDNELGKAIPEFKKGKITSNVSSDVLNILTIEEVKKADFEDYAKVIKNAFTENSYEISDSGTYSYGGSDKAGKYSVTITYEAADENLTISMSKSE
jgi:hypothetical protein